MVFVKGSKNIGYDKISLKLMFSSFSEYYVDK